MIDFKKCGHLPLKYMTVKRQVWKKIVSVYFFRMSQHREAVQCSKWFHNQQSSSESPDSAEDRSKKTAGWTISENEVLVFSTWGDPVFVSTEYCWFSMIMLMHNLADGSLQPKMPCDFNAYRSIEVRPTEDSDTKQFWKIELYLFFLDALIHIWWKYDDYFPKLTLRD